MLALNSFLSAILFLSAATPAFVAAHPAHDHLDARHAHAAQRSLPSKWFHERDHPANNLFRRTHQKRQATGTSSTPAATPSVGSPAWTAQYPADSPDVSKLPKAWTDALAAAVAAGKIPNVPQTTESGGNSPAYPNGVNRNDPSVCAATDRECRIPEDIWDAPDGLIGIGFDDGPTQASPALYTYLQQQGQRATHFMIGTNILNNWQEFQTAYGTLKDDIAVHTWTHPYMTTLSNAEVVGQLGWTIQIIHDSTDGKIPRFWRPPYGDIDTRVSAIAREVFGLTAIIWNQDTEDWSVASGGTTLPAIAANMKKWLTGPKSPGLIILEHELDNNTVGAFLANYPLVKQNGWNALSTAELNSTVSAWQGGGNSDQGVPGTGQDASDIAFSSAAPTSTSSTPAGNTTATGTKSTAASTTTASKANGASAVLAHPSSMVFGLLAAGLFALL